MRAALGAVLIAGICACGAVPAAWAQDAKDALITVAPSRSAAGQDYVDAMRWQRSSAEAQYATQYDAEIAPEPEAQPRKPLNLGNVGIVAVVVTLVFILLVWLRFGGAGTLLSRTPKEEDGAVPEHWDIAPTDPNAKPGDLMAEIRAMPDRGAALVRLLRHALLAAGQRSDTRFAKSDTEREAYARLPSSWRYHSELGKLLRQTELAHYGGRAVNDSDFDSVVSRWAQILRGGRHA